MRQTAKLILELDANAKVGPDVLLGDPSWKINDGIAGQT